jgi:hypothetical protein
LDMLKSLLCALSSVVCEGLFSTTNTPANVQ